MTYSERDFVGVFFKRITACLFVSSEKEKARGSEEPAGVANYGAQTLKLSLN
jgi:hypothetical protein